MQKLLEPPSSPPAAVPMPSPEEDVFVMPCSIAQHRFWLLDQLYPGNTALTIPLGVKLNGPLEVNVLERALNEMVKRHEVLRTSFSVVDGEPKQIIHPQAQLRLQIADLSDIPPEKRAERTDQEMIAEAKRPLSLNEAPIFRTVLLRFAPNDNVLLLMLHHIVGDGWSNGIVVREVGLFYDALLNHKPVDLPPLVFQYADYAIWQQEWIKTPQFQNQMAYWKETFRGYLPPLDVPTDFPRKLEADYSAYIESLLLPNSLSDALKRLCVELDTTLFMVLLAAHVTLLYRYTGQTEFIVGTTAANRNRSEIEHLIGLFANPMILRPNFSGDMSFREFALRLRDHSLNCFAHQEVPFEMILEELQGETGGARKPKIQAHFLYQKAFMEPAKYGELEIKPLRSVSPGSTFELTYGIVERPEGIRLQMEYHTALYKNSTIRRLLRHFVTLLESAVKNPDVRLSDVTLLTDEERIKLESSLTPTKQTSGEVPKTIDPPTILKALQKQLETHFREAVEPLAAVLEPIPGATFIVMDSNLRLLPAGIPGQLYLGGFALQVVSGAGLVFGPLDLPTPLPLLRTDFVARHREDGSIELLGVTEDFAVINGFRVNLRQCTAILLRHPNVQEAAATSLRQASGENQLVCYVVTRLGTSPSEKALRGLLKGKINEQALPSHIVTVTELPKDACGEVVVELLPEPLVPPQNSLAIEEDKVPQYGILYQQLMEIWMQILRIPSLSIDDNFFEIGGNSLLAYRMMLEVEKLFGRPLSLSLLLNGATIANIARYLIDTNSNSYSPLVVVQSKGTRPPLFFLHGDWSGGGFYCSRLSRYLGDDQPFYALPPCRADKVVRLTVKEMASQHIEVIKQRSPQGPYLLGGYCIGAIVAVEVARQLVERGEKVSHLLLIDPPMAGTTYLRLIWPIIDKFGDMLGWELPKKLYTFDRYGIPLSRWLRKPIKKKLISLTRRLGLSAPINGSSSQNEQNEVEQQIRNSVEYAVYFLAYCFYSVGGLTSPSTIFIPSDNLSVHFKRFNRTLKKGACQVRIEKVPGNHITCITEHASSLVEKMREAIELL